MTNSVRPDFGAIFEVRRYSDDYIIQKEYEITNGGVIKYTRCKSDGTWTAWDRDITNSDLVISISKTANFDTYVKTGSGWLNGFGGGNTGNNNPAAIREGEGIFEVLAPASNTILQRWTINNLGIMCRQKTGGAWDAWKFIPWA